MKRAMLFIFIWTCLVVDLGANTPSEKTISSTIQKVTVYLRGAFIEHQTESQVLTPGVYTLVVQDLSPYLDPSSLKISTSGDVTLLSVNHRRDFLQEKKQQKIIENLLDSTTYLADTLLILTAQKNALDQELDFLQKNKSIGGKEKAVSLTELKDIATYYKNQMSTIELEKLKIDKEINLINQRKSQFERQLKELNNDRNTVYSQVVLKIDAKTNTSVQFGLSYFCDNAGWFPTYDLRVEDIDSPLSVIQKAHVYQQTKEDWKDVRLVFSNDDPRDGGLKPNLSTFYIGFQSSIRRQNFRGYAQNLNTNYAEGIVTDESGEPLIGVSVIIKGTNIGTVTDLDGRFSLFLPSVNDRTLTISYTGYEQKDIAVTDTKMNIVLEAGASLDEVVVGYGSGNRRPRKERSKSIPKTKIVENTLNVSIELEIPYTILSNGETFTVDLRQLDVPAIYEYEVIPKLDEHAYLIASITDWEQYQWMPGELNLYFEDAYVGKSFLDTRYLTDTMRLSIGQDESIIVRRENTADFTSKKFIGMKKTETRSFEIIVRNTKKQAIQILIKDQIPISTRKEIEVESLDVSQGKLNENNGEIKWDIYLLPGDEKKLINKYSIKYPKSKYLSAR